MFRANSNTIIPEPSPERVYQCMLYLQKHDQGIKKNEFKKAMTMPEAFGDKGGKVFDDTYGVLRELELCSEIDGKIFPSDAVKSIKSVKDFRKYCARIIFHEKDSVFFQVTSMYCENVEEMMKVRRWDDVNMYMGRKGLSFHANTLKGWRLWAPFLGCGYLDEYFVIPNWAQRVADLLDGQKEFPVNEDIPMEPFMNWLVTEAPEIRGSIKGRQIGLGVSNGLRTLNELGVLQIIHIPDASQWQLVETSGYKSISHVKIVR